jgi:nitrogenase molybdenum-iron protein NifN
VIAICSTGLTETKGDDVDGFIVTVRKRKPELADTEIIYASTPDYVGGFEDGYKHAVTAIVQDAGQAFAGEPPPSHAAAGQPFVAR